MKKMIEKKCETPQLPGLGEDDFIYGCVSSLRQMSGFYFVLLRQSRGLIQCVGLGEAELSAGDWVKLKVTAKEARLKQSEMIVREREFKILSVEILSRAEEALPFDLSKKELGIGNEQLFENRVVSLRHIKNRAIFRIQSHLVRGMRNYLEEREFIEIRTPKIVKEGAEGGANIFELKYFEQSGYLTQSPQFYKEFLTGVFERVFEIGPVFRAEKHNTPRHLNEYTSVDLEIAFIKDFYELMEIEMGMLSAGFQFVAEHCGYELELFDVEVPSFEKIPHISFRDAKALTGKEVILQEEEDLSPQEEKFLGEYFLENNQSEFVFVTHYPVSKRPFYAMECSKNKNETVSFDLLYKGQEVTTGGQRIHSYKELTEKIKQRGMEEQSLEFFTNAHKWGLPPHGGLGLGLERLTALFLNLESVKLTSLFPRYRGRLSP